MNYLLDTSIIIDQLRGNESTTHWLKRLVWEGHTLCSCGITIAETMAGIKPNEDKRTTSLLTTLKFFETDVACSLLAGRIKNKLASEGITLNIADVMIAATALNHELTLVTLNTKHFKHIETLRIVNPAD